MTKKEGEKTVKKVVSIILAVVMLTAVFSGCGAKEEKSWPNGDVTFYIPAAAGGGTDICARLFTKSLNEVQKGNYMIVNDTTGNGNVALENVRNAKPDGNTLLLFHTGVCYTIASGMYDHTLEEFRIIDTITADDPTGCVLFVRADAPWQSFEEFVEDAKNRPEEIIAGIQASSPDHLAVKLFEKECGVKFTCVDGGSNAEKLPLLLGGSIDFMFCTATGISDYVKSGDLRALAVSGTKRHIDLPDTPTFPELGYKTVTVPVILFVAAPKDTSDELAAKMDALFKRVYEETSYAEDLIQVGFSWEYTTPEEGIKNILKCQEDYTSAVELMAADSR